MPARHRIESAPFPEAPGVYVVFEHEGDDRPLYVGVAARQTLSKRWRANHLGRRAGSSSLRRTLGVHLELVDHKLTRPDRYYPPEVEAAITDRLRQMWIEMHPTADSTTAVALEAQMIQDLTPALNVAHPSITAPAGTKPHAPRAPSE